MGRSVWIAWSCVVLACSAPAVALAQSAASPRRTLVFGANADYAPITYVEKGRPKGILIDILNGMSGVSDLEFKMRLGRWQEMQRLVAAGEIDVIGPMAATEERRALFDFTSETIRLTFSIFCRRDDLRIQTPDDLPGKVIGVVPAGYADVFLRNVSGARLVPVESESKGFRDLQAGKIDIFASDSWVGLYTIEQENLRDVRVIREPLAIVRAGFAVKKGNREALAALDGALSRLRTSGKLDEILSDWSPQEVVVFTRSRLHEYVIRAGLVLALIALGGVAAWIVVLRRQVRRKTKDLKDANAQLEHRVEARTREMRRSEERFRLLVQTAPVIVVVTDLDWTIEGVNGEAERLLGADAASICGLRYLELFIAPEERATVSAYCHEAGDNARFDAFEAPFHSASGKSHLISWVARRLPPQTDGPPGILAVGFDMTDKREQERTRRVLEEKLRQSEKLHAMGELAGGVAHDVNNSLTVALATAELMMRKDVSRGDLDEMAMAIREACLSASSLTRQLLTIGRKHVAHSETVTLIDTLKRMERFLRTATAKSGTSLVLRAPSAAPLVAVDVEQLRQVLLNLVINARDAMPRGGEVSIEVDAGGAEPVYALTSRPSAPDRPLRIHVRDTGDGIARDVMPRIFEPFFTTKEAGRGTGLGLALACAFAESSGGRVGVRSLPGEGTTVTLELPTARGALAVATPLALPKAAAGPSAGDGATDGMRILVVDDDDRVRGVIASTLQTAGYRVEAVATGERALALAADDGARIDLLCTDALMPGVNGEELVRRFRALRPDVPVVICSAYVRDAKLRAWIEAGRYSVVHKPFSANELRGRVAVALDARRRESF